MRNFFLFVAVFGLFAFAEDWQQESSPKLNFFELDGYFRTRMDLWSRCDLGTYIPNDADAGNARGTSGCPVPTSYNDSQYAGKGSGDRPSTLFSTNMRLRLDPTLNVTEEIRVKGRADVLDNAVFGSSPGLFKSASYPYAFLTPTVYDGEASLIAIRRLWAEIDTPVGEIRVGRQPLNFGMGLLYNAGNHITQDYGDNVDGVMFATKVWGHYLIPGFFVSGSGPVGRMGGMGSMGDQGVGYSPIEWGPRYDLDPSNNVYSFVISFAKKDTEADIEALLADNRHVFNYGLMGTYRFQSNEPEYNDQKQPTGKSLYRNSNAGFLSLWGDYHFGKLHIESEAVGVAGAIGNSKGLWFEKDRTDSLSILQAGVAIKSRYGFMNNKLGVGLDAGWASGDSAYGMGARPRANNRPVELGDADGQQFVGSDTAINNFRFNPDFRIDLLLFREIIGTVTDAFYLKPHIGYDLTKSLSARLDVISSFSNFAESTPGQSRILGLEFDANVKYESEQGVYAMLTYGLLVPFSGLNHATAELTNADLYSKFGTARVAQALQVFGGIRF
jgi:uncharacterized protein (TIGR04551 family)